MADAFIIVGVFAAVILLSSLIYTKLTRVQKARSLGAGHVYTLPFPWWDPLNISTVRAVLKATEEERLPELFLAQNAQVRAALGRPAFTSRFNLLGNTNVFTMDPKNIQAVLSKQFGDFGLGPNRIGSFLPMLGVGIFASDGKRWEHSRSMLRPNFSREQISDLSLEESHCQDLLRALPITSSGGWTPSFDIQPLFFKLTMDSSTEFFFGESTYSLRSKERTSNDDFIAAFDRAQDYVGQRTNMGFFYWMLNSKKFQADCQLVHAWADEKVAKALDRFRVTEKNRFLSAAAEKETKYVFLDELMRQTQDPIELRSQLLNVLIAGRDTTAGLLSWVFYILSRNPSEYSTLRSAILESFGTYKNPTNITFTSLKSCKPLQNVLNETLRLYPGVPFNVRYTFKDTTLPSGGGPDGTQPIFVPKNTQVAYSVFMMHRDKGIWGEDALDFKPKRWEGLRVGWEYLPFNGGPRICLGQSFSLTSAGYCIVRLLQHYDRVESTDDRDVKIHIGLTAHSANGVHIKFHRE